MPRRSKNKQKKNNLIPLILVFLTIMASIYMFQKRYVHTFSSHAQEQRLICPTPDATNNGLQMVPCYLDTPSYEPSPQPTNEIAHPSTIPPLQSPPGTSIQTQPIPSIALINIRQGSSIPVYSTNPPKGGQVCSPDSASSSCSSCPPYEEKQTEFAAPVNQCGGGNTCIQCNSKPIIYLYPTKPTNVSVQLSIPGIVTVSDPLYPENGWSNIQAFPDGTFLYQAQQYHELYYESNTIKADPPKEGIIVDSDHLESTLLTLTTQLGLTPFEQKEFMDYWLPSLRALHTPYIFISIFSQEQKERVDNVIISPKPDTKIEFLAYFKPLERAYTVKPLVIPQAPKRQGFTTVEWGGTIDRQP